MIGTQSTVSGISPHPHHHSCCLETISVSFQALAEGRLPGAGPVVTGPQGTRLPSRTRQDVCGRGSWGRRARGGGRIVLLCLGVTVPTPNSTKGFHPPRRAGADCPSLQAAGSLKVIIRLPGTGSWAVHSTGIRSPWPQNEDCLGGQISHSWVQAREALLGQTAPQRRSGDGALPLLVEVKVRHGHRALN